MKAYETQQKGWIWLVLPVLAVVAFGASFSLPEAGARVGAVFMSLVFAVMAASIARLEIRDEGERLFIGWGPLPLIRRRIEYARITGAEVVQAPFWLGWGLRWWPGQGWAWIIAGRDLVRVRMGASSFHVGSPEPEALVALIEARVAKRGRARPEVG